MQYPAPTSLVVRSPRASWLSPVLSTPPLSFSWALVLRLLLVGPVPDVLPAVSVQVPVHSSEAVEPLVPVALACSVGARCAHLSLLVLGSLADPYTRSVGLVSVVGLAGLDSHSEHFRNRSEAPVVVPVEAEPDNPAPLLLWHPVHSAKAADCNTPAVVAVAAASHNLAEEDPALADHRLYLVFVDISDHNAVPVAHTHSVAAGHSLDRVCHVQRAAVADLHSPVHSHWLAVHNSLGHTVGADHIHSAVLAAHSSDHHIPHVSDHIAHILHNAVAAQPGRIPDHSHRTAAAAAAAAAAAEHTVSPPAPAGGTVVPGTGGEAAGTACSGRTP
jgi:hypothetical protein